MNKKQRNKVSILLCFLLRHKPYELGLTLDEKGFCDMDELVHSIQHQTPWHHFSKEALMDIVKECPKQRYEIVGHSIRARYGHSYQKISYTASTPPATLFHGTNKNALSSIFKEGVSSMGRSYVHLSETTHFASLSGKRRGELVLLVVDTEKALSLGVSFYPAGGEVWLSEAIPAPCLTIYHVHEDA